MNLIDRIDPIALLKPKRRIIGMSAVLLPFADGMGAVDWPAFRAHLSRTSKAGLTPAVNMDTGYTSLIDDETRLAVLKEARAVLSGEPFVAGAFVSKPMAEAFDLDGYKRAIAQIQDFGGTPIVFQSLGLVGLGEDQIVDAYQSFARKASVSSRSSWAGNSLSLG